MRPPQGSDQFGFSQLRGMRTGFIAGLLVGLLLGWVFHGVVGLVVRLGIVAMLLIPLAVVVWFFFLRRPPAPASTDEGTGMRVFTWSGGGNERRVTVDPRPKRDAPPAQEPARSADDIIDIEFEELKRQVDNDRPPR
jgi:predicted lipid-binding transport protein (Tim44 family)